MIFRETKLKGAYIVEPQLVEDNRGFYARVWCEKEFATLGLDVGFVQGNMSFSKRGGTLRGLHYQISPHREVKLVRCTRGAIYDVIIDLRPESATYLEWLAVELSAGNRKLLYVPKNFAHGFQTLVDETEVFYPTSQFYSPESMRGIRYNDPAFEIKWPIEVQVISDQDKNWPNYQF